MSTSEGSLLKGYATDLPKKAGLNGGKQFTAAPGETKKPMEKAGTHTWFEIFSRGRMAEKERTGIF